MMIKFKLYKMNLFKQAREKINFKAFFFASLFNLSIEYP